MYWLQLIALVLAVAAESFATEAPQLRLVDSQSSAASCQQAPGAALLQQHALISGSRRFGEGAEGLAVSLLLAAELPVVATSDQHVINASSGVIDVSSTDPSNSHTTSFARASANSFTSTSNAKSSVTMSANVSNEGAGDEILNVSLPPADVKPRVVVSGSNDTFGITNVSSTTPSTLNANSSTIAGNNTSATFGNDSSSEPSASTGDDAGAGKDAGEDAEGLSVSLPPSNETPDSVIIDDHNSTAPISAGNDSIINSSTTTTRSSAIGSDNPPTATPSTNSSSANSSVTVNITVSKRGRAETRVKRCHNGMCKVHNRSWHTGDSGEAGGNSANSTEDLSNISDVLKWLDDAFKAPTESNEGFPGGPQPFSGGAGGFAPGGAQWHNWDDIEPDDSFPGPLNALSASLSGGFLQPWLQGSEVGLSGRLPWGLRSRDLVVDQSGRDIIVAYHLGSPEKFEIRQVVALTQVPRGEPLQIYDDASGHFELRWPCGYED